MLARLERALTEQKVSVTEFLLSAQFGAVHFL
jgi:hypothetical protein